MFRFLDRFLDSNKKELQRLQPIVEKINSLEKKVKKLKDEEFSGKTAEFKERLARGETLDDLLPEAFALVREASFRTIDERPFDVQLIAALTLHQGKVAEQKTGEGKTLSAAMPLYLNALTGRGTHLVTVNDYLARVGCGWMGPIYNLLGVSASAIIHDESFLYDLSFKELQAQDWRLRHLKPTSRKEAYKADITYGVNSEFGFDYLRDNMVSELARIVQRELHFAIVDEVDSVLIDEARTPHIISAPDTEPTQKYYQYAKLVEKLNPEMDYEIDEKLRTASLTEHGILKIEKMLGIPDLYQKDFQSVHHIEAALKSKTLFKKDKDYIVKDDQVVIVDEFTGRLLFGRRYSEGLHQAIEAKEGVSIQQESRTLATVSLQNYFRMYEKLAGMTGTAATEAEEFHKIYKLDVVVIPTNKPMIRIDNPDVVYKTMRAKYAAVAAEVEKAYKKGQPVLLGTTSIENNEIVSNLLNRKGISHQLLNAKHHEKEATIITQAGKKKLVTVATNMAGRGVDIILGGAPPDKYIIEDKKEYEKLLGEWKKAHQEIVDLGGLHVVGTERHESRRIDNQLRGRSGRQGDPGSSRFFVCLEDEIMRLFGGEQVASLMTRFKMPENIPLEHSIVSKAIEQAQVKVEGFNFDIRKHLVEYDDVLNKQREIIYKLRREALKGEKLKELILEKVEKEISNLVSIYAPEGLTDSEREKIIKEFTTIVPLEQSDQKKLLKELTSLEDSQRITDYLINKTAKIYEAREKEVPQEIARQIEKWVMLNVIDTLWMDHLDAIDDLREGIGLRGYGQRDPLVEYKNEAYAMFERLVANIDYETVHRIYKVQIKMAPTETTPLQQAAQQASFQAGGTGQPISLPEAGRALSEPQKGQLLTAQSPPSQPQMIQPTRPIRKEKIGRNDPCWCNSGKKWKKCHYPEPPS